MTRQRFGFMAFVFAAISILVLIGRAQPHQDVEHPSVSIDYGHDLFVYYCASCHGRDARGGGPAAPSLKIAPPDLTLITRRYGGIFPTTLVTELITSGDRNWLPSHGSKEMPVWGPILRRSGGRDHPTEVRVESLVSYLKSIQNR